MKTIVRTLLACLLAFFTTGCSDAPTVESNATTRMVYVDIETKRAVVGDARDDVPAVNAATGRRTLMPGLYCPQCRAWRPTPPLDVAQRTPAALRCPQCGTQMTADGPWPISPGSPLADAN